MLKTSQHWVISTLIQTSTAQRMSDSLNEINLNVFKLQKKYTYCLLYYILRIFSILDHYMIILSFNNTLQK